MNPRKGSLVDVEQMCQDSGNDIFQNSVMTDTIPEVEYKQTNWITMKPGMFVLVDFLVGKPQTIYYKYVCCVTILTKDPGDIMVRGYRHYDNLLQNLLSKKMKYP